MHSLIKSIGKKLIVGTLLVGLLLVYGFYPLLETQATNTSVEGEDVVVAETETEDVPEIEIPVSGEEIVEEDPVVDDGENLVPEEDLSVIAETPEVEELEVEEESEIEPGFLDQGEEVVIEEGPVETWSQVVGSKYSTNKPVELGVSYTYPGDQGVSVIFSKLPVEPGHLTIEGISPKAASLDKVVSGVYDITSDMIDGTFAYDISINYNKSDVVEPYLVTSESMTNFEVVVGADVRAESSKVKASLNHFTYFAVVAGEDSSGGSPQILSDDELVALQNADDGLIVKSDDRWPLEAYNPNHYVQFGLDRDIPSTATITKADLKFRYSRSPVGVIPWWFNDYGSKLVLNNGSEIDVWNDSPWVPETHEIDLLSHISNASDLENFRFMAYGAAPVGFLGMNTFFDWVELDVEWVPGTPEITDPIEASVLINAVSESTEELVGVAEANALVSLYINGVLTSSTTADGNGNFTFANGVLASVGIVGGPDYMTPKSVHVTATNADGHVSDPSRVIVYTKDVVSPPDPDLHRPRNNSYKKTDGLVMDWHDVTDLAPEASGLAGYYYESYQDSGLTQLAYRSSLLTASEIPAPGTPAGEYWWHVKAVDNAGNEGSWSDVWQVTVDNDAPTIDLFELSNEWINDIDDLTFNYDVSDDTELKRFKYAIWKTRGDCDVEAMNLASGGSVPTECRKAEKMKCWKDDKDVLYGTSASAAGHTIDDSWKSFDDGTYMVRGLVKDRANNRTRTERIWFGIDSVPPDVPKDLGFNIPSGDYAVPHGQGIMEVPCGGYTHANFQQKISHHWTDESASGAIEYQRQWIYPGGSIDDWHGAEVSDTPYTNYRSFGGIPGTEGEWHVRVRAQDTTGNWSDWSATDASDACSVTYDQTPPVVEITNPLDGDLLRGDVNITGTIDENVELDHYNLFLLPGDAAPWDFSNILWYKHIVGNNSTVSHMLDTAAFPDGEYQIRLAARDKANNRDPMPSSGEGVSVQVIRVTIDNTRPDVAFENPLDGDTVNGLETLMAACDGGVTESRYVNFWWYKAGEGQSVLGPDGARQNHQYYRVLRNNPGEGTVIGDTFSWSLDTTDDSLKSSTYDWDGVWRLRAACKDRAGNYRHTEIDVTVDNTAPVITVNSLSTTDTTPPITGLVDDSMATVTVGINGNTYTATNNSDGTWILPDNTVAALVIGTYDVLGTATDQIGNLSSDTTTNEVTVTEEEQPPVTPDPDDETEEGDGDDGTNSDDSGDTSGKTAPATLGQTTGPAPGSLNPRISTGFATGPNVGTAGFTRAATGATDTNTIDEGVEATEEGGEDGEVLGDTDEGDSGITAAAADQINEGFLGLMKKWWFWLLVAIAVGILIWTLSRWRKNENKDDVIR